MRLFLLVCAALAPALVSAQRFQLPTSNTAIFEPGGEEKYFVGTVGKPWTSGLFGCVRSGGGQFHEGLDIRSLQKDRKGEPTDAVLATAEGTVVYLSPRAALSNYGKYLILRHEIEGLEIYSLYAHLSEIRPDLKVGQRVQSGEPIAVLGRTANTSQGISKDRAHLHFELNFLINERFAAWHNKFMRGAKNDHGGWNGQNLLGLDPQAVFLNQAKDPSFSLLKHIREQSELCRVVVRVPSFSWARRYPGLLKPNPVAEKEGVAGYELALAFNGLPFEIIPRAASELKRKDRISLLSLNTAELQRNPCRHLVVQRRGTWQLSNSGLNFLELLVF